MNRTYSNNTFSPTARGTIGRTVPAMSKGSTCPLRKATETQQVLAMAYVPSQPFESLYSAEEALRRGTLFAALDLPYCTGGVRR